MPPSISFVLHSIVGFKLINLKWLTCALLFVFANSPTQNQVHTPEEPHWTHKILPVNKHVRFLL